MINHGDCPHFTQCVAEKKHPSDAPPATCLLAAGLAAGTPGGTLARQKIEQISVSGNGPGGPGASAMRLAPVPVNRSGTSSTRSPASAKLIEARGAIPLYLPRYSHLNPIEQFFSKLKSLLRKAAARSIDSLWEVIS